MRPTSRASDTHPLRFPFASAPIGLHAWPISFKICTVNDRLLITKHVSASDNMVEVADRRRTGPAMNLKTLQIELSAMGVDPGAADGIFGPLTRVAVAAVLSEAGIERWRSWSWARRLLAAAGRAGPPAGLGYSDKQSLLRISGMTARAGAVGSNGPAFADVGNLVEFPSAGVFQNALAVGFSPVHNDVVAGEFDETLTWTSYVLQPCLAHLVFGGNSSFYPI